MQQKQRKRIALIAHESQLNDLLSWVDFYGDFLARHDIYATELTANLLTEKLHINISQLRPELLHSTQNLETETVIAPIDFLVFFWVPSEAIPNDPGIKALLQIANDGGIPVAANRTAADFMFSSYLI
jgi:methylglyoxal synthase